MEMEVGGTGSWGRNRKWRLKVKVKQVRVQK